jgi:hypothetical protein
VCAEHGYKADITINEAAGVLWLNNVLPDGEIFLHAADGQWSPSGNCHSTINIWHPRVREVVSKHLTAFGAHYRDDPRVVSYELVNEPSLSIERRVQGYQYETIGVGGYSPAARAEWQAWLRRRYKTVEALNARWGTAYETFSTVLPPADLRPPTPTRSDQPQPVGPIYDFQLFRAESHAEHFQRMVAALKAGDPRKPVMPQFIAGFGPRPDAACDLLLLSTLPEWDFFATHDWPGDGPAVTSLFAYSIRRYKWRPHWEDEFIWSQWQPKSTPEPEMRAALIRNLWRQIAWGKRGISLFNLETEWLHDSPSSWNNSIMNIEADYRIPRYSTGAIPVIERKANLLKDVLFQMRLVNQGLAILLPTSSVYGAAPNQLSQQLGQRVASAMLERHILPLVVPEECITDGREELSQYLVVVVPWGINMPTGVQHRLAEWVRGGGTLVALGPPGLFDEYGRPSGTLISLAFGPALWQYDAQTACWTTNDLAPFDKGHAFQARLGTGRVTVLPTAADPQHDIFPAVAALMREAIPQPLVTTAIQGVELLLGEDETGARYLFAINLDVTTGKQGIVAVRGHYSTVRELTVEGAPRVPTHCADGLTRLPLSLQPGEGQLFALGNDKRP